MPRSLKLPGFLNPGDANPGVGILSIHDPDGTKNTVEPPRRPCAKGTKSAKEKSLKKFPGGRTPAEGMVKTSFDPRPEKIIVIAVGMATAWKN